MEITIQKAKNSLSELIRRAQEGEEIILMQDHHPVVKLVPIFEQEKPNRFGMFEGDLIYMAEDFNDTPDDFAVSIN